jgi:hypothetical protein
LGGPGVPRGLALHRPHCPGAPAAQARPAPGPPARAQAFRKLAKEEQQLQLPIYAAHGGDDVTTSLPAVRRLVAAAQSQDKTLKVMEGGWRPRSAALPPPSSRLRRHAPCNAPIQGACHAGKRAGRGAAAPA